MSDGTWGKITGPVTVVFIGAIAILYTLAVWDLSASKTQNAVDASRYAAEHAKNAEDEIKRTCVGTDVVASVCIQKIVKASQESQRAEYDLSAQQEMARAARWMLAISVLSAFVTGVGIYYVRENLLEMQRQRHTFLEQFKARVFCDGATYKIISDWMLITPKIRNFGQTPAEMVRIEATLLFNVENVPIRCPGGFAHLSNVQAGTHRQADVIFQRDDIGVEVFDKLFRAGKHFQVLIKLEWADVFGGVNYAGMWLSADVKQRTIKDGLNGVAKVGTMTIRPL